MSDIDDGGLVLGGVLARLLWHERPELVEVDAGLEVLVPLEVEVTLALLAVEAGVTAQQLARPTRRSGSLTICSSRFYCAACHLRYRDQPGAFYVYQLCHDPLTHGPSSFSSS